MLVGKEDFDFAAAAPIPDMTDLVERWPAEILQLVLAGMTSGFEVTDDVFTSPANIVLDKPRTASTPSKPSVVATLG